MTAQGNKRGPKPKVTAEVQAGILKHLRSGVSLVDAAIAAGIDRRTVQRAMRSDPLFAAGAKEARRRGKIRQICKVTRSKDWKAAAWYLERVYGEEFGRKERHEHTGKDGGPIESSTKIDLGALTLQQVEALHEIRRAALVGPSCN